MASTARHLELVPHVEPSTDFPALEEPEHDHSWIWILGLVIVGALVIAGTGYLAGRSSAPQPAPAACVQALDRAQVAFTNALAQFGTIEEGALAVMDGERPEIYSVLGDARLGQAELQQLQQRYVAAAAACRSAG
jgi:hypothetical protein